MILMGYSGEAFLFAACHSIILFSLLWYLRDLVDLCMIVYHCQSVTVHNRSVVRVCMYVHTQLHTYILHIHTHAYTHTYIHIHTHLLLTYLHSIFYYILLILLFYSGIFCPILPYPDYSDYFGLFWSIARLLRPISIHALCHTRCIHLICTVCYS